MAVRRKPLSASVIKTLTAKAKKSKLFSLGDLKKSFRRGQAAWLTGSRPKIGQTQWAFARINKLIRTGRLAKFDRDIVRTAVKRKRKK